MDTFLRNRKFADICLIVLALLSFKICRSTNLYACVLVYSTNVYSFSCMVSVLGNEFINCLFSILFHLCFVLKFMVVFSIINMTQLKLKC